MSNAIKKGTGNVLFTHSIFTDYFRVKPASFAWERVSVTHLGISEFPDPTYKELNTLVLHTPAGHGLGAFSPQMNAAQTTASKNEIDDSVEFASAVKTQQLISECRNNRRESSPSTATSLASDSGQKPLLR